MAFSTVTQHSTSHASPPRLRSDGLALGLLLAVVALAWISANSKWSAAEWQLPGAYLEARESDVIGMLATFKAAADGHFVPLGPKKIPELGAPGVADWADNPVVEEVLFWATGLLARFTGLFVALNIKLLLAHLLAGGCFYGVARYFHVSCAWAFTGALAFALAPFIFSESPHHSNVVLAWHVPLFLIVWNWAGSGNGIIMGSRQFWLAFAIACLTGLQNVYYTNIFCQLTLLAGGMAAWRTHRLGPLLASLGVITGSAFAFGLMAVDTLALRLREGPNQEALVRSYHWLEIYALKLVDMFVPPPVHQIDFLAEFSAAHARNVALVNEGSYLGVLGIMALCLLVFVAVRAAVRHERIPAEFWQTLWIFLVFTTGGLNSLAGIFGLTLFRAGYRAAIVIHAIVLMFLVRKASRWPTRSPLLAALASALVLIDQVPRHPSLESQATIALMVESDREFVREMERRLPEGAMVYQLPVMDYPESPVPGITPYEHLRPYLYSSKLRYSFGSVKGRDTTSHEDFSNPPNILLLVSALKNGGFDGLYINTRGYQDRAKVLIDALKESGLPNLLTSKVGDLVFFRITPDDKAPPASASSGFPETSP